MTLPEIIADLQELVDGLAVDLARYGCLGLDTDRKDFLQECHEVCEKALELLWNAADLHAVPFMLEIILEDESDGIFDHAVRWLKTYCEPGGYRAPRFDIPEAPDEYKTGVTGFESMHYVHMVLVSFISLLSYSFRPYHS